MKRRNVGPSVSFFAFQDIITAVVGIFILILLILVLELTQRVEAASSPPAVDLDQIQSTIDSLTSETERLQAEYESRLAEQSSTADINEFNREDRVEELKASLNAATEMTDSLNALVQESEVRIRDLQQTKDKLTLESADLEDERDLIAELNQRLAQIEQTMQGLEAAEGLVYRDTTAEGKFLTIISLSSRGITLKDAATKTVRTMSADQFKQWLQPSVVGSRHILLLVSPSGAGSFEAIRELLINQNCLYGFDAIPDGTEPQLAFEWEIKE